MPEHDTIRMTLDYIEKNLDANLSLDEIANKVGYSKFHLCRMFAESMGCTLYKYIQTRRLTIAAEKLTKTTKPIIEIAREAHYDSQQAFTLAFKQLYLCTPQKFRVLGVHAPKINRLIVNDSLVRSSQCNTKREVMAA